MVAGLPFVFLGRALRSCNVATFVALVTVKAETARARLLLSRLLHYCGVGQYPVFFLGKSNKLRPTRLVSGYCGAWWERDVHVARDVGTLMNS
jgi:hypothetical protein